MIDGPVVRIDEGVRGREALRAAEVVQHVGADHFPLRPGEAGEGEAGDAADGGVGAVGAEEIGGGEYEAVVGGALVG